MRFGPGFALSLRVRTTLWALGAVAVVAGTSVAVGHWMEVQECRVRIRLTLERFAREVQLERGAANAVAKAIPNAPPATGFVAATPSVSAPSVEVPRGVGSAAPAAPAGASYRNRSPYKELLATGRLGTFFDAEGHGWAYFTRCERDGALARTIRPATIPEDRISFVRVLHSPATCGEILFVPIPATPVVAQAPAVATPGGLKSSQARRNADTSQ